MNIYIIYMYILTHAVSFTSINCPSPVKCNVRVGSRRKSLTSVCLISVCLCEEERNVLPSVD